MKNLIEISVKLQNVVESFFSNYPTGSCYLFGHCLTEILSRNGYQCRKVSGSCSYLLKSNNGKLKYVHYGQSKLNGHDLGSYHTWCEVQIDGKVFIVDPSIKYNKYVIRKGGFKLTNSIPDLIVSDCFSCTQYLYVENKFSHKESEMFLKLLPQEIINKLVSDVLGYDINAQLAA